MSITSASHIAITIVRFTITYRSHLLGHYNPHMLRAEQTSAGPVGPGTQFRTEVTTRGRSMEVIYEITTYERPQRLAGGTNKGPIDVQSTEIFDSVPEGTHFRWVMNWSRAVSSS